MARQEDFVFAEHVLRRRFATEAQVEECLQLLDRLRAEMQLEESLENLLLKKGYLAPAQAAVIQQTINPTDADRAKNQIEGYRLLSRLGGGAMGSVYKAEHLKLKIPVALKVLRVELAKSKTQIERLKREAHLAARLNHPNIVRSLDVGESNGFHYFAMEYVDGSTVRDALRKSRLREKDALRILRDTARALEVAHHEGIIHRDIKPGNIMLTREKQVKLADFGLARGQEPSDLTLEHASIGTPQYLAPEQARRGSDATSRSDLFSLGATLYHMVTGRPPFAGDNLGEVFQNVLACRFQPPESLVPDLSLDTVYLIHRLMRANPRQRYASATDLLTDLARVEAGQRIAPPGFRGDYQAYLTRRRQRRVFVGVSSAAVLSLSIFLIWSQVERRREQDRVREACRVINDVRRGQLDGLTTLVALDSAVREMDEAKAREACRAEAVADLENRLSRARADAAVLRTAEDLLDRAKGATAPFRSLFEQASRLEGHFAGVNQRLTAVRDAIADRSRRDAYARRQRYYNNQPFATREAAVKQMKAFADELSRRYVETSEPWVGGVMIDSQTLARLLEAWDTAETDHGPEFEKALEAKNFGTASRRLRTLRRERENARNVATSSGLDERFLHAYPLDDGREARLASAEEDHWTNVVLAEVDGHLPARPDLAEQVLNDFRSRADRTKPEIDQRIAQVAAHRKALLAEQKRDMGLLEDFFRNALRDRNYATAARRVLSSRTIWILEYADRYAELHARAEAVLGLLDQFLDGAAKLDTVRVEPESAGRLLVVPGKAIERAGGDDEDLFVVKTKEHDYPLYLRDFTHEELERIFAFDPTRKVEIARRGYFNAAEAFRFEEADPYYAAELRRTASADLGKVQDSWDGDVKRLLAATERRIAEGEDRATLLYSQMRDQKERKDHEMALALCEELHARFSWTEFFKRKNIGKPGYLDKELATLKRLATRALRRVLSGVPGDNFVYDPESGRASILYQGRRWYPDEGRVPGDVQDREAWLLEAARPYWRKWAKQELAREGNASPTPEEFEAYVQRALDQLLDWGGPVTAGDGRYRMEGGWQDNQTVYRDAYYDSSQYAKIKVLTLRNHFDVQRDWQLEFTVSWDPRPANPKAEGSTPTPLGPGYFAVSAGTIQAGLLAIEPLVKKEEHGGGSGVVIFEREDMFEEVEDEFADFYWRFVTDKKHRKPLDASRGKAYVDDFKVGVRYRMRLERIRDEIHFWAAPLETLQDGKFVEGERYLIHVSRKFPPRSRLRKALAAPLAGEAQPVFRFFSFVRCDLEDVKVSGILAGSGDG